MQLRRVILFSLGSLGSLGSSSKRSGVRKRQISNEDPGRAVYSIFLII